MPEVIVLPLWAWLLIGALAFVFFTISGKFADWVTPKILKFFDRFRRKDDEK